MIEVFGIVMVTASFAGMLILIIMVHTQISLQQDQSRPRVVYYWNDTTFLRAGDVKTGKLPGVLKQMIKSHGEPVSIIPEEEFTQSYAKHTAHLMIERDNEAQQSAVLQDGLECIMKTTHDDSKQIAQETLEAVLVMREQNRKRLEKI